MKPPVLDVKQLSIIGPHCPRARLEKLLPHIVVAMAEWEVDVTPQRMAAFLAQTAHESMEWRRFHEIGGQVKRYAPFWGRGAVQLTHRYNYEAFGAAIGVDLVSNPDAVASDGLAFRAAGWFWKKNGLNELADKGEFILITRRINGGLTHQAERERYHTRAKAVLGC